MASRVTLGGELLFPNDFLSAVEFKGMDVALTITAVQLDDLQRRDGKTEKKPVVRFRETKKKLVLNKTNADTIAEMHGTEASKWVGKRVTLYPTRAMAFGEMVDCVRVREKAPAPSTVKPALDDDMDRRMHGCDTPSELTALLGECGGENGAVRSRIMEYARRHAWAWNGDEQCYVETV